MALRVRLSPGAAVRVRPPVTSTTGGWLGVLEALGDGPGEATGELVLDGAPEAGHHVLEGRLGVGRDTGDAVALAHRGYVTGLGRPGEHHAGGVGGAGAGVEALAPAPATEGRVLPGAQPVVKEEGGVRGATLGDPGPRLLEG